MDSQQQVVYTVGHSNMTMDEFLALLKRYGVQCVVDVRRVPYSRFVPQFNRENLQRALATAGITYIFEGEALGGQPKRQRTASDYHETDKADYEQGIERLRHYAVAQRIAIMCAEEDYQRCHRRHIADRLVEASLLVRHLDRKGERGHPIEQLKLFG